MSSLLNIPKLAFGFLLGKKIKIALFLGISILAMELFSRVWENVVYVFTDSVPANILWKLPDVKPVRGDYILAEVSHEYIPDTIPYLTKFALCAPGDHLTFDGQSWFCNGEYLNSVKPETKTGFPLVPYVWAGDIIPEGYVFMGSSHPDGFDSRYLGLIAFDKVTTLKELI